MLDVRGRDDLGREVEPLPKVIEALRGEGVVIVLPRELRLHVTAGSQGLEGLDDIQIANAGLVG